MKINQLFLAIGLASLPLLSGCLTEKEKQDLKDRILLTEEERKAKKLEQQRTEQLQRIEQERLQREKAQRELDEKRISNIKYSANSDIRKEFAYICNKQNIPFKSIEVLSSNYAGKNSKGQYVVNYEIKVIHLDDNVKRFVRHYQGSYYYQYKGLSSNEFYPHIDFEPISAYDELGDGGKVMLGTGLYVLEKLFENSNN